MGDPQKYAIISAAKLKDFNMSIDSPIIYKQIIRDEGEYAAIEFMESQIKGHRSSFKVFIVIGLILVVGAHVVLNIWGSIAGLEALLFWAGVSFYASFNANKNGEIEPLVLTQAKYELEHETE